MFEIISNLKGVKRWMSGSNVFSGWHGSFHFRIRFDFSIFSELCFGFKFLIHHIDSLSTPNWQCWHYLTALSKRSWENYLRLESESDFIHNKQLLCNLISRNLQFHLFSAKHVWFWGAIPFTQIDGIFFNTGPMYLSMKRKKVFSDKSW